MDKAVRQALLKNDSIASQLDLSFAGTGRPKTVRIKLEIDVNPPLGSGEATTYLDFPADYEVRHQDLASNFALKIHALLCRGFLKGRDWRSEEHTSELQSLMAHLVCRLLLEKKKH